MKWFNSRVSLNNSPEIIKIKELAISVSFDYKDLSLITKHLDSLKLIHLKDYIVIAI